MYSAVAYDPVRCLLEHGYWHLMSNKKTDDPQREKTYLLICAPKEDSNYPAHPHNLTRVFVAYMKKPCILFYSQCTQWIFCSDCAIVRLIWIFTLCTCPKIRYLTMRIIFCIVRLMSTTALLSNEPAHDETYHKTCVFSKDSDQPVHPPSMAWVLVYPFLNSLAAVKGTCDQRRLWSGCAERRLIWVFAGRTRLIVGFVVSWPNDMADETAR